MPGGVWSLWNFCIFGKLEDFRSGIRENDAATDIGYGFFALAIASAACLICHLLP